MPSHTMLPTAYDENGMPANRHSIAALPGQHSPSGLAKSGPLQPPISPRRVRRTSYGNLKKDDGSSPHAPHTFLPRQQQHTSLSPERVARLSCSAVHLPSSPSTRGPPLGVISNHRSSLRTLAPVATSQQARLDKGDVGQVWSSKGRGVGGGGIAEEETATRSAVISGSSSPAPPNRGLGFFLDVATTCPGGYLQTNAPSLHPTSWSDPPLSTGPSHDGAQHIHAETYSNAAPVHQDVCGSLPVQQQTELDVNPVPSADFSVPDLADPLFQDSQSSPQLMSPLIPSSSSFLLHAATTPSKMETSSSLPGGLVQDSPAKASSCLLTPTSPPKRKHFHADSASSFARFPTPDRFSLNTTPPATDQRCSSPEAISVPAESLPRSESGRTLDTIDSHGSLTNSASNVSHPMTGETTANESFEIVSRQVNRRSVRGLEGANLRASLIQFPSPPTSPRTFEGFGSILDKAPPSNPLAAPSLSSSKISHSTTPNLTSDQSYNSQQSEEVSSFTHPTVSSHTSQEASAQRDAEQTTRFSKHFPAFFLPPLIDPENRHNNRVSMPPNIPLPALPEKDTLVRRNALPSSAQAAVPLDDGKTLSPGTSEFVTEAPAKAVPTPLSHPLCSAQNVQPSTLQEEAAPLAPPKPIAKSKTLKSSKSSESLLGRLGRKASPSPRAGDHGLPELPFRKSKGASEGPTAADDLNVKRKRRASLSIKIPKILSKLRRQDELNAPGLPDSPNNAVESRFSPDSEAPSPAIARNFVKRLTRAVSSPNLKNQPSFADPPTKRESRFVTPVSAPPVPATFSPIDGQMPFPRFLHHEPPFGTPDLSTDAGSSVDAQFAAQHYQIDRSQKTVHAPENPYFPSMPVTPSLHIEIPADTMHSGHGFRGSANISQTAHIIDWQRSQLGEVRGMQAKADSRGSTPTGESSSNGRSTSACDSRPSLVSDRPSTSASGRPNGASNNGSDDEGEDDDKRYRGSESSDDYDEYGASDENEEDEGVQEDGSDEDDLPLARTHPDALKAQRSLRASVKKSKRKDKVPSTTPSSVGPSEKTPKKATSQKSFRSTAAGTLYHQEEIAPLPPMPIRNPFGFSPNELAHRDSKSKGRNRSEAIKEQEHQRPDSLGDRPHALLLPQTDEHVKRRNGTSGRSGMAPPLAPFVQDSVLTMSEGSDDDDDDAPLQRKSSSAGKRSHSNSIRSTKGSQRTMPAMVGLKISTPPTAGPAVVTSANQTGSALSPVLSSPRSPVGQAIHNMPGLVPIAPSDLALAMRPAYHSRQRVYINDPQHHITMDIDERTTAASVLSQLRGKSMISSNPAWSVIEIWRTFGVERPLRDHELLQECIEAWGVETNASLFLVKKIPTPKDLPATSEEYGAWVQMEVKRNKWSKRWLLLKGQNIYVGKSEKRKDLHLLCTLANFEAYMVPQACIAKLKTPKPFAFALKSVEKMTFFENADQDYIHYFSVKTENERDLWMRLVAETRSPLIKQMHAARSATQTVDTRTNMIASTQNASPASTTTNPRFPSPLSGSQAVFAEGSLLGRKPSTSQSQSNVSSAHAQPSGHPAGHTPSGREWNKIRPEERRAYVSEANRTARGDGQRPLLDLGYDDNNPPVPPAAAAAASGNAAASYAMNRNRSQSVSTRR